MTREEALNEIRSWAIPSKKGREVLETLIPELAESEDERMLQTIIRGFENWKSNGKETFNFTNVDDILAYLEKQKEQKHTELTAEERMKNDKHFLSICQHLETLISESKNDEAKESIDKDYRWLCEFYRKSLSAPVEENYKEPAEWSAKGRRGRIGSTPEHIRKKAENFLSKMEPPYDADDICSAYETGAMESIKQEWSEEDEKMLRTIISDGSRGVELDSKQISWLKSLRPSWKPSEEQMKALEDAFRKDGSDEYRKTINSLYQDLKKL